MTAVKLAPGCGFSIGTAERVRAGAIDSEAAFTPKSPYNTPQWVTKYCMLHEPANI